MAYLEHKKREILFQILFSMDYGTDESVMETIMVKLKVSRSKVKESYNEALKVQSCLDVIDSEIDRETEGYAFDRISSVEKNILRLAFYELIYEKAPKEVIICEAMRLSKKFSSLESTKFINAVIDAKCKSTQNSTECALS